MPRKHHRRRFRRNLRMDEFGVQRVVPKPPATLAPPANARPSAPAHIRTPSSVHIDNLMTDLFKLSSQTMPEEKARRLVVEGPSMKNMNGKSRKSLKTVLMGIFDVWYKGKFGNKNSVATKGVRTQKQLAHSSKQTQVNGQQISGSEGANQQHSGKNKTKIRHVTKSDLFHDFMLAIENLRTKAMAITTPIPIINAPVLSNSPKTLIGSQASVKQFVGQASPQYKSQANNVKLNRQFNKHDRMGINSKLLTKVQPKILLHEQRTSGGPSGSNNNGNQNILIDRSSHFTSKPNVVQNAMQHTDIISEGKLNVNPHIDKPFIKQNTFTNKPSGLSSNTLQHKTQPIDVHSNVKQNINDRKTLNAHSNSQINVDKTSSLNAQFHIQQNINRVSSSNSHLNSQQPSVESVSTLNTHSNIQSNVNRFPANGQPYTQHNVEQVASLNVKSNKQSNLNTPVSFDSQTNLQPNIDSRASFNSQSNVKPNMKRPATVNSQSNLQPNINRPASLNSHSNLQLNIDNRASLNSQSNIQPNIDNRASFNSQANKQPNVDKHNFNRQASLNSQSNLQPNIDRRASFNSQSNKQPNIHRQESVNSHSNLQSNIDRASSFNSQSNLHSNKIKSSQFNVQSNVQQIIRSPPSFNMNNNIQPAFRNAHNKNRFIRPTAQRNSRILNPQFVSKTNAQIQERVIGLPSSNDLSRLNSNQNLRQNSIRSNSQQSPTSNSLPHSQHYNTFTTNDIVNSHTALRPDTKLSQGMQQTARPTAHPSQRVTLSQSHRNKQADQQSILRSSSNIKPITQTNNQPKLRVISGIHQHVPGHDHQTFVNSPVHMEHTHSYSHTGMGISQNIIAQPINIQTVMAGSSQQNRAISVNKNSNTKPSVSIAMDKNKNLHADTHQSTALTVKSPLNTNPIVSQKIASIPLASNQQNLGVEYVLPITHSGFHQSIGLSSKSKPTTILDSQPNIGLVTNINIKHNGELSPKTNSQSLIKFATPNIQVNPAQPAIIIQSKPVSSAVLIKPKIKVSAGTISLWPVSPMIVKNSPKIQTIGVATPAPVHTTPTIPLKPVVKSKSKTPKATTTPVPGTTPVIITSTNIPLVEGELVSSTASVTTPEIIITTEAVVATTAVSVKATKVPSLVPKALAKSSAITLQNTTKSPVVATPAKAAAEPPAKPKTKKPVYKPVSLMTTPKPEPPTTPPPPPTIDPDLLGEINEGRISRGMSILTADQVDVNGNILQPKRPLWMQHSARRMLGPRSGLGHRHGHGHGHGHGHISPLADLVSIVGSLTQKQRNAANVNPAHYNSIHNAHLDAHLLAGPMTPEQHQNLHKILQLRRGRQPIHQQPHFPTEHPSYPVVTAPSPQRNLNRFDPDMLADFIEMNGIRG